MCATSSLSSKSLNFESFPCSARQIIFHFFYAILYSVIVFSAFLKKQEKKFSLCLLSSLCHDSLIFLSLLTSAIVQNECEETNFTSLKVKYYTIVFFFVVVVVVAISWAAPAAYILFVFAQTIPSTELNRYKVQIKHF